ncbi:MAG: hypothetical protein ACRELX_12155, partial [Longimicrobiales bacterium]
MSTSPVRPRTQDAGTLRWLADAYARYAHLVVAQLEALDEGDIGRVQSLALERDALALEIDGAEPAETLTTPGAAPALAEVRQAVARAAKA